MQSYIKRAQRLENLWNKYSNGISMDEICFSNKTIISGSSILYAYDLDATFEPNDIDIFTSLGKKRFEKLNFVKLVPYFTDDDDINVDTTKNGFYKPNSKLNNKSNINVDTTKNGFYKPNSKLNNKSNNNNDKNGFYKPNIDSNNNIIGVYLIEGTKIQVIICKDDPIKNINKTFDFEFLKSYYNGDIIYYNQNLIDMKFGEIKYGVNFCKRMKKYINRGIELTKENINDIHIRGKCVNNKPLLGCYLQDDIFVKINMEVISNKSNTYKFYNHIVTNDKKITCVEFKITSLDNLGHLDNSVLFMKVLAYYKQISNNNFEINWDNYIDVQ